MSASAFLQLRDALVAHLQSDPAIAAVPVYANRVRPIGQEEDAAVNLVLSDSKAAHVVTQHTDWHTGFFIDCAARAVPGVADAATVADALLRAVYARMAAFAPPALGVIDMVLDEAIRWDHAAEDVPYASATLRVTVQHRTPGHTLQPAP